MGDAILSTGRDIRQHFGEEALRAIRSFQQRCRELCSRAEYYEGHPHDDNRHPWANKTFAEILDEIPDENARKYIAVAARSDLATEPHLTTALNGLKNVLMDDSRYLRLYSIVGGIERLIDGLKERITADVRLRSPVVSFAREPGGTYRLRVRSQGGYEDHPFDMVVFALPNYWLQRLEWGSRELRMAMEKHLAGYDHPAHYLRMSLLFRAPFWRDRVTGSYFMSDAFGGCCVYDEGARHPCDPYGVLGWLVAGNDALSLANHGDDDLVALALDSLPGPLAHGRRLMLEGRVHRWAGTINALPGGNPVRDTRDRHVPDRRGSPRPLCRGRLPVRLDAQRRSRLGRLRDRPDPHGTAQTEVCHADDERPRRRGTLERQIRARSKRVTTTSTTARAVMRSRSRSTFCEQYTIDLIRTVWGWSPPYTLLDCGSASGQTLEAFARVGVEAWGVENSQYIHSKTPRKWRKRNLLADVRKLPFPDNSFDFVYDTCLCYLPEEDLDQAIAELFRVCRVGVFYGGIATDMTREVIEAHDLFDEVRSFLTLWEWSEAFLARGSASPRPTRRSWPGPGRSRSSRTKETSPGIPTARACATAFSPNQAPHFPLVAADA